MRRAVTQRGPSHESHFAVVLRRRACRCSAAAPRRATAPSCCGPPIDAPYQLASGDRLRVIVFGQDNLTNSFSVDGAGNISMPLIGLVRAQGLTTAQLAGAIEARLRAGLSARTKRLGRSRGLSAVLRARRSRRSPGQYPFVNGMTVQNAIAIAGGFTPRGAQDGVDLTRIDRRAAGDRLGAADFPVRPGDTITVRERFF